MTRAALLLSVLALPAAAQVHEEPAECPAGQHRVQTDNPYDPLRCVPDDQAPKKGFDSVVGPKGFSTRPRCPRGTHPVSSTNSLQPYRCVRDSVEGADPELAPIRAGGEDPDENAAQGDAADAEAADPMTVGCPRGKRKVRTNDPLNPFQCVAQATRVRTLDEGSFSRYTIPRQLSFEYSRAFRVEDSWKEDVPTLYLKIDDANAGKPTTITITYSESNQNTYQDLSTVVARDSEWRGAKDGGVQTVAGRRARVTFVPGDARTVYLPVSKDSYYTIVYSAAAENYESYLPAFSRLLKTLRLDRNLR